jgi:molecular chaperone HtpG
MAAQTGKIGVSTDNIFPIIKKFLYSDHEIFLREIVSNAIDASQKLKMLASSGDYKGDVDNLKVSVSIDTKKNTITVSDNGIGMSKDEIEKYINQIAFSSAEEFLEKYKNQENAIIGHFGLGFYSAFMVSKKVEIITKSYKENEEAIQWSCDGSPEYQIDIAKKDTQGTDVILYIDDDSKDFVSDYKIRELLRKYCKFLPFPIVFGKIKDWKDGKEVETDKDNIINNVKPAWTKKPTDLKDEDYMAFYHELYPVAEDPLFYIHLNVDYPFNLTGILYFPKIKSNIEIQRNKIQLYCRQVYVTDSVEGIVPDFLTLLHGVIDSPDIPLNVSRSYLQSDQNVKKISSHITKKVADRLQELFNNNREEYEKKWDNLKLFIEYGMITDEKFYERAEKFSLFKNIDGKYFTFDEYEKIIKENQTDKNKNLVYLYTTNKDEQYTFIEAARSKGYDVLIMDGQLDTHFISNVERKLKNSRFSRVDAEVINKLIQKEDEKESKMSAEQKELLTPVFKSVLPEHANFNVMYESLAENDIPAMITQSEWMRRMKDMSSLGGGMNFYGEMPESFNIVINSNHPLSLRILSETESSVGNEIKNYISEIQNIEKQKKELQDSHKSKKEEEIPQAEKDQLDELSKKHNELEDKKNKILSEYGKTNKMVKQLTDLALLANNMLKGEALSNFVKRSIDLIK